MSLLASVGATAAATEAAESNVSSRIMLRPSMLDKQTANFSKTLQGGGYPVVHQRMPQGLVMCGDEIFCD